MLVYFNTSSLWFENFLLKSTVFRTKVKNVLHKLLRGGLTVNLSITKSNKSSLFSTPRYFWVNTKDLQDLHLRRTYQGEPRIQPPSSTNPPQLTKYLNTYITPILWIFVDKCFWSGWPLEPIWWPLVLTIFNFSIHLLWGTFKILLHFKNLL